MPQRYPLSPIDVNRAPRSQLSVLTKHRVWARCESGIRVAEVSRLENIPESTIRDLLRRAKTRRSLDNIPRKGRPRQWTKRDERAVLRAVRLHPKLTFNDLKKETGLDFSTSTLKRILKENHIEH
nr:hypothetical protein CFP56_03189 [Quercus suber]